jgi:hypothetical protein
MDQLWPIRATTLLSVTGAAMVLQVPRDATSLKVLILSTTNCCSFQMRINLASIPPVLKWWCPLLHIQAAKCPSLRRAMGYNALEPSYTIHTFLSGICYSCKRFQKIAKTGSILILLMA